MQDEGQNTLDLETALEDAAHKLRPRLHRFCARMTGSVLDGEDVVQETLASAFSALPSLQNPGRLEPWLFRIAHNKCLDFLRRERRARERSIPYDETHDAADDSPDGRADEPVDRALAALVSGLPPMERACVLLKDVLDYQLTEIADVVDSTVAGVKAALHRGRVKLRVGQPAPGRPAELDAEERRLVDAYVDRFNLQDWDSLKRLIQADARVELVGVTEFEVLEPGAPYFNNYAALPFEWKLAVTRVDGVPLIAQWQREAGAWHPIAAIRLWWRDGKVARIRDYFHVSYILAGANCTDVS